MTNIEGLLEQIIAGDQVPVYEFDGDHNVCTGTTDGPYAKLARQAKELLPKWIPVSERLPEPGVQVPAMRSNGTWDRAECNPIYFEGLPAWYMPEGPTPCGSWTDSGARIVAWLPTPPGEK